MNSRQAFALTLVMVFGLSACQSGVARESVPTVLMNAPDEGRQTPILVADDPMASSALKEVGFASDLILIGTAASNSPDTVTFGSGAGALQYTRLEVVPERIVKGQESSEAVVVLMLTRAADGGPLIVEGRPDLTDKPSVWLLRGVPPEFGRPANEYVLTSIGGIVPGSERRRVAHANVQTSAYREAAALQTIDRVAEYLAEADNVTSSGSTS